MGCIQGTKRQVGSDELLLQWHMNKANCWLADLCTAGLPDLLLSQFIFLEIEACSPFLRLFAPSALLPITSAPGVTAYQEISHWHWLISAVLMVYIICGLENVG